MGASIEQEVAEPSKLPDEDQRFSVRMFAEPDMEIRFPVQCVLDADVRSRQWFIQPTEDSMIAYRERMDDWLRNQLRSALDETNVHIFSGSYAQPPVS